MMKPEEEGHRLVNGPFRLCSATSSCNACLQQAFNGTEARASGDGDEGFVILRIKIAESWAGD